MTGKQLTAIAAAALVCGTAQADDNWYATAKLGLNQLGDQNVDYVGAAGSISGKVKFDGGFAGGGVVGYTLDNDWRLEGEILYRTSELDTADIGGFGAFSEGDYSSLSYAVNGIYDFNLLGDDRIRSYVGIGIAWLQEIDIDFEQNGVEQSFSGDDIGLQAMFGARYNLGEKWFLDAELRYFYASGIEMNGEEGAVGAVTADYDPFTVGVSVGFRF